MKDTVKQIILLIIAACIGFFANEYKTNRDNRLRYVDYHLVSTTDVFNRFSFPSPQITVKAGDKEVDKVTQIELVFQNPGERDFENIPVYIDFTSNGGEHVEILGKSIVGEGGMAEGVENVSLREVNKDPKTIRCSFNIRLLNRDKPWSERPRATFLIRGNSLPLVDVKTSQKGLDIRRYDFKNYESIVSSFTLVTISYLIAIIVYYVAMRAYLGRKHRRFLRRQIILVKQCILANRHRLQNISPDELRLLSLEIYEANASDEIQQYFKSIGEYLQQNEHAIQDCNESVAEEFAKTIVMKEDAVHSQKRSKLDSFLFPRSQLKWEDLDSR